MSIKGQALRGVKWTSLASVVNAGIQFTQIVILTKWLDPRDFGLIAIVMVVVGFSQLFIDMGVSNAIIYKKEVTEEQLSSLYWLNIFVGIAFSVIIVSVAPLIAAYYENNELVWLIRIVAITFLVKPWGQQFMVLLQKELKFNVIAKIDIVSRLISFVFVILLAYYGLGVYSLVIGVLILAFCTTIGYNLYGRVFHKPKFQFKIKEIEEFIHFGLYQMGEKTINFFSSQFDTILIGKLLGMEALGLYNVAKNLVSKPSQVINPVITKVTFPLMSKIREDIYRLKIVFLKSLNYLSLINFPIHLLLSVFASPIVLLFFGNEWEGAIPLVQVLALTYLLRSIGNPTGSLLLSRGKAKRAFYWNLIVFVFYPISIFIGSIWDIRGVTIGTFVLQLILILPNWKYNIKESCKASFREYFSAFKMPFFISVGSISVSMLISTYFESSIYQLAIGGILIFIIYSLVVFLFYPNIFQDLKLLFVKGNIEV